MSAWIEIICRSWIFTTPFCRTPCECVDWNTGLILIVSFLNCRTPCECVDWNRCTGRKDGLYIVALHVSAWIEIIRFYNLDTFVNVALHVSAWIEILPLASQMGCYTVALHVSAWIEILPDKINGLNPLVALHVSAWIEILHNWHRESSFASHSMWVRGLKFNSLHFSFILFRRTPCECVDWNTTNPFS